ncbi:MAG TPA: protein kinase [Thermoanaerobaculia bacterium]|jgi:serine/threonine-protein kinase|nr:protein kinase [Thermoanaerobaculia bacterium]
MIERVLASNYRVVEKVGEGGMGAVYRAVDLMLERDVAIKAIKPELSRDPEMVERFRTEARTLAKVSHPAIATIYSFFQDNGELFLAMEFVRGRSLSKVLEAEGAFPWDRAVRILGSALDGIAEAHRAGIIHRDLKPDNLMITGTGDRGGVKVTDFGIARMAGSGHLTRTGLMVGTLRYMAPEQIQGEEADARSDIYSLGGVLYQMLTGRPAFEGKSDYAILKAQIEEMPAPPSTAAPGPGIPAWLDRAVLRALAKKPADRFQSVPAMRRFLDTRGAEEEVQEDARPFPLVPEEMEELPTVVTPPRPLPPPLPPLPPIPTAPSSRPPAPSGADAKPGMSPVVPPPLPTMASGAPPVSTDVGLYRPIPQKRSGLGWKLAVAVAAVLAVLTGAGLALFTGDDTSQTAQETPPAATSPEPAPADETAETPDATVEIAPASTDSGETEETVEKPQPPLPRPRPVPATEPAEDEQPEETEPEQTTAVYQPPVQPEPSPVEPEAIAAPFEELKQVGTEIQTSSAGLFTTYQAWMEQKENGGGEITDDDEELEELLEGFAGSAEKFNKYIQGGGFLQRLRHRGDTEVRPLLAKRMKDLANQSAQVDTLMARVQPGAEIRQAWQQLRQRGQRAGRLVAALQ